MLIGMKPATSHEFGTSIAAIFASMSASAPVAMLFACLSAVNERATVFHCSASEVSEANTMSDVPPHSAQRTGWNSAPPPNRGQVHDGVGDAGLRRVELEQPRRDEEAEQAGGREHGQRHPQADDPAGRDEQHARLEAEPDEQLAADERESPPCRDLPQCGERSSARIIVKKLPGATNWSSAVFVDARQRGARSRSEITSGAYVLLAAASPLWLQSDCEQSSRRRCRTGSRQLLGGLIHLARFTGMARELTPIAPVASVNGAATDPRLAPVPAGRAAGAPPKAVSDRWRAPSKR